MNNNKFSLGEFIEIQRLINDFIYNFNIYYQNKNKFDPSHSWSKEQLLKTNNYDLIETVEQFASGQHFKVYKQDNKYQFLKNDVDDYESCKHLIINDFEKLTTEIYILLDNALYGIGFYL